MQEKWMKRRSRWINKKNIKNDSNNNKLKTRL